MLGELNRMIVANRTGRQLRVVAIHEAIVCWSPNSTSTCEVATANFLAALATRITTLVLG